MPVISRTIASMTGRAVSIRWGRTYLSKSIPFSAGNDWTRCCSATVNTPRRWTHEEIAEQVGANVLRSPAHVVLLKATDSFADGGFDFSLGFS